MNERHEYAQYKAQRIKEHLQNFNVAGSKILDFGCNDGLVTNYLQELFWNAHVIGVDQETKQVQAAQKKYPALSLQAIKKQLPFEDNSFDAAIAADVFHHIRPTQHKFWSTELVRTIKPGGYFILLERNPWSWSATRAFTSDPLERNARMLSPRYANRLLHTFGTTQRYFYNSFFERFSWLHRFESVLSKLLPGSLYVICLKKR